MRNTYGLVRVDGYENFCKKAETRWTKMMEQNKEQPPQKILSQEELLKWWPFQRACGKSLEKLHKQSQKKVIAEYEESPI